MPIRWVRLYLLRAPTPTATFDQNERKTFSYKKRKKEKKSENAANSMLNGHTMGCYDFCCTLQNCCICHRRESATHTFTDGEPDEKKDGKRRRSRKVEEGAGDVGTYLFKLIYDHMNYYITAEHTNNGATATESSENATR